MSQGAAGRENLPSFSVTSSSLTGFNNSDPESSKDTGWLQASSLHMTAPHYSGTVHVSPPDLL